MSRVRVHIEEPAILAYTFEGCLDEEAFADYLTQLERSLQRGARFAVITVASAAVAMPLAHRQRLAAWLRQHRASIARYVAGCAFVSPSPRLHFVLSTIIVIEPMVTPYVVTATFDEALVWARASLAGSALLEGMGARARSRRSWPGVTASFGHVTRAHPGVDKRREL